MSNREQVHALFRGSAEIGKKLRTFALLCELAAGVLAAYGVFAQGGSWAAWEPLVAFGLVAAALFVRAFAVHLERFAESCRWESIRAYAAGTDIEFARLSSLRSDALVWAERIASRLPASSMDDYYEPECPEGEARLREIYASSAFHTWHLLRNWAWIIGLVGVVLLVGTFVIVYGLATNPLPTETTADVLDALCSIVLAVLSLRALETAFSAWNAASSTRKIADALVSKPVTSGKALDGLVRDYDFERTGCAPIPTWLYKWRRDELSREWQICKKSLSCQPQSIER